ncbi:MAG: HAD family hydrolase [Spirochaetaceae bacterium]|jgi:Cof subfamily protein (haloacid dehalogenase superfamily)|nr:HAD family hydrolase [Spirochaetaceae bacterium]
MNEKIVFVDIDGTLVDGNGEMPESAQKACVKARENGHLLCIATGRQYSVIGEEILSLKFNGIISAGGARVDIDDKMIAYTAFSKKNLSHIVDYFESRKIGCTLERAECLLASKRVFEHFNSVRKIYGKIIDFYTKYENVVEGEINSSYTDVAKVIFCDTGSLTIDDIRKEFSGECEVFRGSMPFYGANSGEICPIGINKGAAVNLVLKHYGINKENSIAIGDGDNDIPMLKSCGHGIAMGNGDNELKKAAEYITDSVENDGLLKAFIKYGLI